jgi:hypothetical protein
MDSWNCPFCVYTTAKYTQINEAGQRCYFAMPNRQLADSDFTL